MLNIEVAQGQDPGLVNFARQTIPMIESHLKQATSLYQDFISGIRSMGTQSSTGTSSTATSSSSQDPASQPSTASYAMGSTNQDMYGQSAAALPQSHPG